MNNNICTENEELARNNEKLKMMIYILEKENEILKENYCNVYADNLFLKEKKNELDAILYSKSYKILQTIKRFVGRRT